MNVSIDYLCNNLASNTEQILALIDADPLLNKREVGDLILANASKELFSPVEEHQLYAKGIIYQRNPYRLIGMPYTKIYNHDENDKVREKFARMIQIGATPVWMEKLDGTLISRNVIDGKVVLTTRGMLESDGENASHIDWAWSVVDNKHTILDLDFICKDYTLLFELIGPENRIITFYPEWDLVLTGAYNKNEHRYLTYGELIELASSYDISVVDAYGPQGATLVDKISDLNKQLVNTDKEGTVIQFELNGEVVGRIKAKSDTYKTLLRVASNCTYDTTAELLENHPELHSWEALEAHLTSLGRFAFPEELMDSYKAFYEQYVRHIARCKAFVDYVKERLDWYIIPSITDPERLGLTDPRAIRKEVAMRVKDEIGATAYFAHLDGKLDLDFVKKKVLKTPEDSEKVFEWTPLLQHRYLN